MKRGSGSGPCLRLYRSLRRVFALFLFGLPALRPVSFHACRVCGSLLGATGLAVLRGWGHRGFSGFRCGCRALRRAAPSFRFPLKGVNRAVELVPFRDQQREYVISCHLEIVASEAKFPLLKR